MRRTVLFGSLVILAGMVAAGQTPGRRATAEALFREALAAERAEGNLNRAIFTYERLIADFSGERTIAAQAMFQLAAAYEKLGDPRSRLLLTRLTRDFGDVEPYAARARARLSALQNAPAGPFPRVALDQYWAYGSPDGALIVYHKDLPGPGDGARDIAAEPRNWSRLYVRDLATGAERVLVDHPGNQISNLAWAPDSRRLAYNVQGEGLHDLRAVEVAGGRETSLGVRGYPIDWSETGEILYYLPNFSAGGRMDYSLIPASGGTPRKVHSSAECCPLLTPDGTRLITPKSKRYVVMDLATGKEEPLTAFTGEESEAILSPDGRLVSFAANHQGRWAFYVAPFDGSLPVRRPIEIDDLEYPAPVSSRWYSRQWWTRKGLLTFQLMASYGDIYRVDVDPATARAIGEPVRLTQDAAQNWLPSVSPDNRRIAYWYSNGARMGIAVMDRSGANERPLLEQGMVLGLHWQTPEELLFLRQGQKEGERLAIHSLNVNTGAHRPVVPVTGIYWRLVPGRDEILHAYPGAGGPRAGAQLKATSIGDGKERVVATIDYLAPHYAVSQDGRRIAYSTYHAGKAPAENVCRLAVIPVDGGPESVLIPDQAKGAVPLAWSPNGRFLLYFQEGDGTRVLNIQTRESWPLLAASAAAERPMLQRASWSPDGTFIAFEKQGEGKTERLAWDGVTAEAVARLMSRK